MFKRMARNRWTSFRNAAAHPRNGPLEAFVGKPTRGGTDGKDLRCGSSPAAYSSLGSMAFMDAKARGKNRMPLKQRLAKGVRGGALPDRRDMARA